MLWQIRYRFLQRIRNRGDVFWSLLFPLVLATLFYVAFGSLGTENWKSIPVALVEEKKNPIFSSATEALDGSLLQVSRMSEEDALDALEQGAIAGIFYEKTTPSLTVSENGVEATILETYLDTYIKNAAAVEEIIREHPEKTWNAIKAVADYQTYVEPSNLGGRSYDYTLDYFFALIAMACFFGCFPGMSMGEESAAFQSPLAARRCVAPLRRTVSTVCDVLVGFLLQFANVVILLLYLKFVLRINFSGSFWGILLLCAVGTLNGVCFGIVLGCVRIKKGLQIGLAVLLPLLSCFLSGMMVGNMKYVIEQQLPIINRLNPAALISDGFYYLSIYPDSSQFLRCILTLLAISAIFTFLAIQMMRRSRYESI